MFKVIRTNKKTVVDTYNTYAEYDEAYDKLRNLKGRAELYINDKLVISGTCWDVWSYSLLNRSELKVAV